MVKKVFCKKCKIPMIKRQCVKIGEKRYICPKCGDKK